MHDCYFCPLCLSMCVYFLNNLRVVGKRKLLSCVFLLSETIPSRWVSWKNQWNCLLSSFLSVRTYEACHQRVGFLGQKGNCLKKLLYLRWLTIVRRIVRFWIAVNIIFVHRVWDLSTQGHVCSWQGCIDKGVRQMSDYVSLHYLEQLLISLSFRNISDFDTFWVSALQLFVF